MRMKPLATSKLERSVCGNLLAPVATDHLGAHTGPTYGLVMPGQENGTENGNCN